MNIKKTLFAAVLALGCISASAQEPTTTEVFNPHWYVQVQGGVQHTVGEVDFSELLAPNAQIGVGYNFSSVLGARFSLNGWQSKAGSRIKYTDRANNNFPVNNKYKWAWNYVTPAVDLTVNVSNLICGFNPNRVVNLSIFGGVGANIAFNNDEAADADKKMKADANVINQDQLIKHLWGGTSLNLNGRAGLAVDFRLSDKVSLGVEGQANFVNDHYNSKHATNVDTYFNVLAGVKVNLGKTHVSKEVKSCDPVYIDRIVEKPVEKIVEKVVEKQAEPLKETIFYEIRISDPDAEAVLNKVVAWCNKYPTKTISVRGYADKGTGNAKLNKGYAEKRANKVAQALQDRGISADRIFVASYGDTVQPYAENDKNRCVIIVGE